ncbi:MAG: fibronectin type III domain-containing protein [Candidatus Thermoplasmatota archaeon]|nr:fibronectin type III domain-containing protein [Candidatus Thermoplasmatota archaeon]
MKCTAVIMAAAMLFLPLFAFQVSEANFHSSEPLFIQDGDYVEHTPSIVQLNNGTFLVAYESAPSINGPFTINMTWSPDGVSWSQSWIAIQSSGSMGNRHPSLIQRNDGSLMLAYCSDRTGLLEYRLYTATSTNAINWTESGPLAVTSPAVNPFLIKDGEGYAMSYQVYTPRPVLPIVDEGSYFTSSADGENWTAAVRVSGHTLPRLMRQPDGGMYLMTLQGGGSGNFEIRASTSSDGVNWSSPFRITETGNNHDSFPMNLANGTYALFYASAIGDQYDLFWKWSSNLLNWSSPMDIGIDNPNFDTQPHALELANGTLMLAWGYESEPDYGDVDIALAWLEYREPVPPEPGNVTPVDLLLPLSSEITPNSATLRWTQYNGSTPFQKYEIYLSLSPTPGGSSPDEIITRQTTTTLLVDGLTPATTYHALVRVYDTTGEYADSNIIQFTTIQEEDPQDPGEDPGDEPGDDVPGDDDDDDGWAPTPTPPTPDTSGEGSGESFEEQIMTCMFSTIGLFFIVIFIAALAVAMIRRRARRRR